MMHDSLTLLRPKRYELKCSEKGALPITLNRWSVKVSEGGKVGQGPGNNAPEDTSKITRAKQN